MHSVPSPAPCLLSVTRCIARVCLYDASESRLDVSWPPNYLLCGVSFGFHSACPCRLIAVSWHTIGRETQFDVADAVLGANGAARLC